MSYQQFAYYYDSLMDPQFYEDYEKFILEHAKFKQVLELGCGTGEMAIRLMKQGKQVLATDLSEDMLNVASEKASGEKLHLYVEKADMTDFVLSAKIDCVLCLCDSLNYVLKEKDIIKTFRNVHDCLNDHGTFIFDVNSLYKHNVILNNYHEESHDDDYDFVWDVKSDLKGSVEHHVVIEDRENNEKVDEIHRQKTLSVDKYIELLKKCHFDKIDVYSDFNEYKEECERVIFVCRKRR